MAINRFVGDKDQPCQKLKNKKQIPRTIYAKGIKTFINNIYYLL